jgi:hypothetical protein
LRRCLELVGYPFSLYEATGTSLVSIIEALPSGPAGRLRGIAKKRIDFGEPSLELKYTYGLDLVKIPSKYPQFRFPYCIYGQDFSDRISSFEITLTGMTPDELIYFYLYLKDLVSESHFPRKDREFNLPYLKLLASANAFNVRRIRQEILSYSFTALIQPIIIEGILLDYPAHPSVSGAMYITAENYYNCDNIRKTARRTPLLNIVKMDNNSAVVQVRTGGQAWDKVFLKRKGKWIIVGDYPYSTRPPEDSNERHRKEFINTKWGKSS